MCTSVFTDFNSKIKISTRLYNDTSKKFILSLLFEEKPVCKLQIYAFVYFILKSENRKIKYFLFYFGKDRNPY